VVNDIRKSVEKLKDYIENHNYRGWDPYDILKSPLFKLPFFKESKKIRFYFQQFGKRFPINIRPLLLVPKGYNPVTLGLCIQGYSYLLKAEKETGKQEEYLKKILFLIEELENLIPDGYSGACWGYDFPWEARNASIPEYQPTIVATGIITNALFECYRITKLVRAIELCTSASKFVLNDLNIITREDKLCFSYSPFDEQMVFNASMKGVRLLSQVFSHTKDEKLLVNARKAIDFVISNQNPDGSWPYSLAKNGNWVDNYHTGYILDCMDEYVKWTGDTTVSGNLKKGYQYYIDNFFEDGCKPKFYNYSLFPIDSTAAAQSILTLCRFGDIEKAERVALFISEKMQNANGSIHFRLHRYYSQRTSFMRWSNSWMFAGLSYFLFFCREAQGCKSI
jgi:hypothetical protein